MEHDVELRESQPEAPIGAPWESYLDGPEVAEPRTLVTWPCVKQG